MERSAARLDGVRRASVVRRKTAPSLLGDVSVLPSWIPSKVEKLNFDLPYSACHQFCMFCILISKARKVYVDMTGLSENVVVCWSSLPGNDSRNPSFYPEFGRKMPVSGPWSCNEGTMHCYASCNQGMSFCNRASLINATCSEPGKTEGIEN